MSKPITRRDALALSLLAGVAAVPAWAQGRYPDRPIRLVVPFSAGGVVDVVARLWVERVRTLLGGTLVIENIGGAGGTVGAGDVARAQPDGYTLLLGNTSTQVINPTIMPRPPYDGQKDFVAVSIIAVSASAFMVHPSVPAKTFKEFVDYAKANAGKLSYGSAGAGTITNVCGEMFKQMIGAPQITHIPYRGAGPATADLVSGHIPLITTNVTSQNLELHRSGRIRILAVAAPERLKAEPDIPTAGEALPGLVAQLFTGLFAPAGTPREIVDRLGQASVAAMDNPAFQKALVDAGLEPVLHSTPDHARRFVQDEHARLIPVIKATGMKAE
jgi:tripartite-type tricarboxylate transporter receptor subunit TctC